MRGERLRLLLSSMRVNQWIKNFVVFTALLFSGQLFNGPLLLKGFWAFLLFCVLSSIAYVLNDIIDYQYDRLHPVKRLRPIASGAYSIREATFAIFMLTLAVLIVSLFISIKFFFLALTFLLLHLFYSLYFKRFPVVDIFAISFSFMIRAFAGEIATGLHIPIWLLLTIFFGALFIATVKRHAEFVVHGTKARSSLFRYKEHLLDFLTTTTATTTIIAYSLYTYLQESSLQEDTPLSEIFNQLLPRFEARKWMMITIPFVVYGIARYAQLLYEQDKGEQPEQIITRDKPLITTIVAWALTVILLLYVL